MLRDALPHRPEARRILFGTLFSALGKGLTMPFLFIYLTEVLHLEGSVAGLLIGWFGAFTLVSAPLGGTLIDRLGARRVVLPMMLVEAVGLGSLAFVSTWWQVLGSLSLAALGAGSIWSGQSTILTSVTGEQERQKVFGLQFALLNLGIGVGAAISGSVVEVARPVTFQFVYLADALCYLAPFLILLTMPHIGHRLAEPRTAEPGVKPRGYGVVLRNRPFRRLIIFSLLLTVSGYAQMEVGFTGFAINVVKVTPQIVGYAFTANTVVIVIAQLFVIKKLQGRSRTRALSMVGGGFATAWLVLGLAGLIDGSSVVLSAIGVITFGAVFALGETLLAPTHPALVNALATDELRGRYNALASMVWGISGIIAPVSAGPLIQAGLGGFWIALVITGCLVSSLLALSLRRMVTAEQDGREEAVVTESLAPIPA